MSTAETLRALLDGPHTATRERVRWWLSQPGNEPADDLPIEEHRARVLEWTKELASEGDTAIGYPVEYGGKNDPGAGVTAFETLAMGDLSLLVKCGVQFGLFGGAILHLGTEKHHARYLRDVGAMDLPGCYAMTETGHGSNVQALRTTATYDPQTQEFVVNTPDDDARKDYIGNAARDGRLAVVFAQLITGGEERGVHALLVPIRDEDGEPCDGVRIEDCGAKLGLNGVDNGRLWFDNVRVPRENLLDKLAQVHADGTYFSPIENPTRRFFTMLGTLIQGRISVGGASISASKVALTIAVRRALERRQFGPPGGDEEALLMDYRTHQRRLLVPLAKTYALSFTQLRLVEDLHAVFTNEDAPERERRELETLAAGVKAIATWHATDTIQGCREACGGAGYLRSSRFASLKADTDVFTTFEGDNTILLQLAAKNLLTDYKDAFGELDKLGMAQFVAGQALSVLSERVPLRKLADSLLPGRDDDADLLAHKTQLDLFRWRHEHLLAGAARRLKGGIDAKRDPFDVLVDTQDHVLDVARSWVDLVILESFVEAAKGNALLSKLCTLYALSVIEAERGYFQEHGRLSATRSKGVVKAVNTLCGELRPHVRDLVDAFGVPETALGDARLVADEQEQVPA
ncbi:acyl-CoA dehydrogenase family protein [Solirubrobacter sp. CPCC 204708]|uniref:Acyl-CoA dehydrogenase family protein n=1 Tax=Solirubrobacter deserti TaxID=2282478 RepID=A0ABT4RNB2_9ACTN|nr:acyl-CoA dehydrogenase [Solirubrobacter deserti]MBE2317457.1 acyl-CoA dehydrogenase family protein [Solirubrobacter deserti]MDA0140039.1 acyl-CoA dehydrogenase family protein [Solirubrobacter deserti]